MKSAVSMPNGSNAQLKTQGYTLPRLEAGEVRAAMSKARRRPPKSGPVWQVSALEATRLKKPRYNGWACGTGVHGDVKYNRAKEKRNWNREAPDRGLPFS
ncbi:MAG: hypothetical protein ACI36Y_04555, partial [Coriobacteriales bacterium]